MGYAIEVMQLIMRMSDNCVRLRSWGSHIDCLENRCRHSNNR